MKAYLIVFMIIQIWGSILQLKEAKEKTKIVGGMLGLSMATAGLIMLILS